MRVHAVTRLLIHLEAPRSQRSVPRPPEDFRDSAIRSAEIDAEHPQRLSRLRYRRALRNQRGKR